MEDTKDFFNSGCLLESYKTDMYFYTLKDENDLSIKTYSDDNTIEDIKFYLYSCETLKVNKGEVVLFLGHSTIEYNNSAKNVIKILYKNKVGFTEYRGGTETLKNLKQYFRIVGCPDNKIKTNE